MTWTSITQIPRTLQFETQHCATYDGKIYVFGIYFEYPSYTNTFDNNNRCYAYDIATDTWELKATRIPNASGTTTGYLSSVNSCAVHGSYIYLIGALDNSTGGTQYRVLRYDPSNDSYTRMADVPATSPVSFYLYSRAFTIGDAIYVLTYRLSTGLGALLKYNVLSDTWESPWTPATWDAAMQRGAFGGAVFNGKIYTFGGYWTGQAECYDPATDTFTQLRGIPDYTGNHLVWAKSGTITHVTDRQTFRDTGRTEVEDVFAYGIMTFTGGANDGFQMDVQNFNPADGTFTLFLKMPYDIAVGDTYTVTYGCDKKLATCLERFDNKNNFRGEPHVPGSDRLLDYEIGG